MKWLIGIGMLMVCICLWCCISAGTVSDHRLQEMMEQMREENKDAGKREIPQ